MKDKLLLFVDGSVDPKLRIGYGAYLAVNENEQSVSAGRTQVKVKNFEETSSTKLELQTLVWALTEIHGTSRKVVVFTDSQNIIGLPSRRENLEQKDFCSQKNKQLINHKLYREFYKLTDQLDCELTKVGGHLPSSQKDHFDKLFVLVDKASRKALKGAKQLLVVREKESIQSI